MYSIFYRVHMNQDDIGWGEWFSDGAMAGADRGRVCIDGIQIKLEGPDSKLDLVYQVYLEGVGWQDWVSSGEVAGSLKPSIPINAVRIDLVNNEEDLSIIHQCLLQRVGWQGWISNSDKVPSNTNSLKAIKIKLIEA